MNFLPLIYALLLLVGGLIGFLKAGSLMSIATSGLAAVFLVLGWIFNKKSIVMAVTILLTILFTVRFIDSFKFMPAGLMVLISGGYLFYLIRTPK